MPIAKLVEGLLGRDDFNRANNDTVGNGWVEHASAFRVANNRLEVENNLQNQYCSLSGISAGKMLVQCVMRSNAVAVSNSVSVGARWDHNGGSPNGYYLQMNMTTGNQFVRIVLSDNGSLSNIANVNRSLSANTDYDCQLFVDDDVQEAWFDGDTLAAADPTHNGTSGRTVGVRGNSPSSTALKAWDGVVAVRDKIITVQDRTDGEIVRILDSGASTVAEATVSGGVAVLDVSRHDGCGQLIPYDGWPTLVVRNAGDTAEVDRYDEEGIYPGTVFYEPPPPAAPPATGDPADVVTPPTGTITTGLEGEGGVPFVGLSGSVGRFQLVTGLHVRALDLNDSVDLEVSTDGDLSLDDVREGRVVRIVDPPYGIFEYRISEAFEEESATGRPTIRIRAVHPLVDLADRGLYEEPTVEGGSLINPGEITDTVPGWVERIIAAGARNGAAYYVAGSDVAEWGTDVEYTIDVSGMTPLAVLYALRERLVNELTGEVPELVVQRTGDEGAYEIDILRAPRNSDLPRRRLSLGTTISRLAISRGAGEQGPVITVIRPLGRVPEFGSEPSSIADLVLEVTAIDGNAVTVQLPEIGVLGYPAILWDDQFGGHSTLPNRYALLPDGTLEEITDTIEADQELVLDDASGLSVGDLIGIRTDTGGAVVEIVNPGAFDQYGRRVASPSYAELRGERNWVPNPWLEDWDAPYPDLLVCEVRVSQTSTTLAITGLTEGDVISAGDVILIRGGNAAFGVVVETGDTADVSGEADPVMEQAFTVTAGEYAYIFRQAGRFPAEGWRGVTAINGWLGGLLIRRPQNDEDLGLAYDGTITSQDWQQAESGLVEVTALPTSRNAIGFGDQFRFGSVRAWVAGVASDSGSTASVYLLGGTGTGSGAVRIDQPPLHLLGVPGETVVATPEMPAVNPQTNRPGIETGLFTVRAYPGRDRGWAVVRFLIWPIRSFPDDAYAGDRRARIRVVDGTGTVLATAVDVVRTLVDGAAVAVSLGVEVELDADTPQDLRVQFLPGAFAPGLTEHQSIIYYLSEAQFTLGPDPDVPATKYAWANQMYTRALNELDARSVPQQTVEVTYNDLSYQPAFGPDNYSLDVGQSVRLVGRRNQATARVYRREVPLEDPTRTNLVVGPDLVRLTRRV